MSLNGLDAAKVVEAHEAATAEPGGWYDCPPIFVFKPLSPWLPDNWADCCWL
jgi:hypothetical protein